MDSLEKITFKCIYNIDNGMNPDSAYIDTKTKIDNLENTMVNDQNLMSDPSNHASLEFVSTLKHSLKFWEDYYEIDLSKRTGKSNNSNIEGMSDRGKAMSVVVVAGAMDAWGTLGTPLASVVCSAAGGLWATYGTNEGGFWDQISDGVHSLIDEIFGE